MHRPYFAAILMLAIIVFLLVAASVLKRPKLDLPAAPSIEVAAFEPPKREATGIDLIDRALEFGVGSDAVRASLERVYFEAFDQDNDHREAASALIDATFAVAGVADDLQTAEIGHLRTEIDRIHREVRQYQAEAQKELRANSGLSWAEGLALLFAGLQALAATVGMYRSHASQ